MESKYIIAVLILVSSLSIIVLFNLCVSLCRRENEIKRKQILDMDNKKGEKERDFLISL